MAEMKTILSAVEGIIRGKISAGEMVLNDYRMIIADIEGGHRLIAIRGSEVQTIDIMDGEAGFAPTISIAHMLVQDTATGGIITFVNGYKITVKDINGEQTIELRDGLTGKTGNKGASAEIRLEETEEGVKVTAINTPNEPNMQPSMTTALVKNGKSPIQISSEEPVDENIEIWIKPDGKPEPEYVTKEEVEKLSEEIADINVVVNGIVITPDPIVVKFEYGAITSDGGLVSNTIRIRTDHIPVKEGINEYYLHDIGENVVAAAFGFAYLNGEYVRTLTYGTECVLNIASGLVNIIGDGTFDSMRFVLKKSDESAFTQEEVNAAYLMDEPVTTEIPGVKNEVFRWNGKLMASIGDSITEGYIPRNAPGYPGVLDSYVTLAAERLGMEIVNKGITGSTVTNQTDKNPMCNRYNELPDDADIVTVMGGTNDIRVGVPLGSMSDRTSNTYYGALHVLLGGLYKKYYIDQQRNTKIIVMTPIKLLQSSSTEIGGTGVLVEWDDWIEAVKKVAAYYSLPVLDMYNLSRINPHLNQTVRGTVDGYTELYNPYITDGTHPTQAGHELMADALVGFIRGLE